jgi:antitoxin component YwqK of YwqJK toxin-antitoxin module
VAIAGPTSDKIQTHMIRHIFILTVSILFSFCTRNDNDKLVKISYKGKLRKETIYLNPSDTINYTEVTYDENGILKDSIDFRDGRFNGKLIRFHKTGKKDFEGQTKMGSFYGLKINYDEKGNRIQADSLFGFCPAPNCCCDAIITRYFPNGVVKERYAMASGKFNGFHHFYNSDGSLKMTRTYLNDTLHGPTVEYNKEQTVHGQFSKGKEQGEWKFVDSTGKIIGIETFKDGKLIKTKYNN